MADEWAGLPDESEDFAGLPAEGDDWAGLPPEGDPPGVINSLKRMVSGQPPRGVSGPPDTPPARPPDEGAALMQPGHQVQVPLQSPRQAPQLPKIQRLSMPRGMAPTTSGGLIQAPGTDQNVALSGIATNEIQNEALPAPIEQLTRSGRAEPGTPAWADLPEAARQNAETAFAQTRRGGTGFAGKLPGQQLGRGFEGEAGPATFGNALGLISTEEEQPNRPLAGHETLFEGVPAGQPLKTRSGTPQSLREKAERDTAGWSDQGTTGQIAAGLRQGVASFLDSMGDPSMLPLMALGPAIKVVGAIAGPRAAMILGAAVNGKFGVDIALGAKDRITNELIPAIQARDVKATTAALAQLTFEVGMLAHPAEMTDAAGKTRIGLGGLVADTARAAKGVGQVAGETLPRPGESKPEWLARKDAADAADQDFRPLDPVRERTRAIEITQALIEKKYPGATVVPVEASRRVYPGVPTPAEAAAQPEGTPPALQVEPVPPAPPAEFRVTKPDGSRLVVRIEQNEIQKNLDALKRGEYTAEQALSDTAKVAGTSESGLIRLVNNVAGEDTVDHENVHEAFRRGLFTDQERENLIARYGKGAKTEAGQEEAVAKAMEAIPSLMGELRNRLGPYLAKHGIETAGAAEARFRGGEVMARPARPGTGPSWEWGTEGKEGRWPEPREEAGPEVARNTIDDIQAGRVVPPEGATSIPAVPEEAPISRPLHPHEARAAEEALARGQAPLDDFLGLPPEEPQAPPPEPQVPAELANERVKSNRQELRDRDLAAAVPEGKDTYGRTGAIPRPFEEPPHGPPLPPDTRTPIEKAKAEIREVLDRDGKIRRSEVREIASRHLGADISGKAAGRLREEVDAARRTGQPPVAEATPTPARSIDLAAEPTPKEVISETTPAAEATAKPAAPPPDGSGAGSTHARPLGGDTGGNPARPGRPFTGPGEQFGPPPTGKGTYRWKDVGGTHAYLVGTRFGLLRENVGGRGRPKYQLMEYVPERSISNPIIRASGLTREQGEIAAERSWRESEGLIKKRDPGAPVKDALGQMRRIIPRGWRPKGIDIPDALIEHVGGLQDNADVDAQRERAIDGAEKATAEGRPRDAAVLTALSNLLAARKVELWNGHTDQSEMADRMIAWNVAKEQQARKLELKRGGQDQMQDGPPVTADDWDSNPRFSLKEREEGDRRSEPRDYLGATPGRRVKHLTPEEFAAMSPQDQFAHVAALQRETDTNPYTGLPGRPAFEKDTAAGKLPYVGQSDIDGLKWANDNLPGKYAAGTGLIRAKGHALQLAAEQHGTTVYHEKGDEFFVGGGSEAQIKSTYDSARDLLSRGAIKWTADDGRIMDVPAGLFGFSHGIGRDEYEAGKALAAHKDERTAAGLRAERGLTPPGVAEEIQRRGPIDRWGTADDALPGGASPEGAGGADQPAGPEVPRYQVKDDSRLGRGMAARETDRARPIHKLIEDAKSAEGWKDWYQRHQPVIDDLFGDDAHLFRDLLAATSQGATVEGNVSLAVKAYDQIKGGKPLQGLGLGTANVERAARGEALRGPKIGEMQASVHGDTDRFVVDRWVSRALFGTDTPTKEQHARGQLIGTRVAKALGWTRQQFQSALWVASKIAGGEDPGKVASYAGELEKRADDIRALRSAFAGPGAEGAGAPERGAAREGVRGGAPEAGDQRPAWAGEPEGEARYSLKQREDDHGIAAPTFFSAAERAIKAKMPWSATAEQVKGILSPANGVKPEELQWTGIDDLLRERAGQKISRDELLQHLRDNQVEVVPIQKGGNFQALQDKLMKAQEEAILARDARLEVKATEDPEGLRVATDRYIKAVADREDAAMAYQQAQQNQGTKFQAYQLPGGENYREVLLQKKARTGERQSGEFREFVKSNGYDPDALSDAQTKFMLDRWSEKTGADRTQYKGPHFDEPDILAHLRLNDRTDSDGKKTLFLEETQSDWGQKLRESLPLRDLRKPDSVRKQAEDFFGGEHAVAPPLDQMDGGVFALLKHKEVVRDVVSLLPVDMVDQLGGRERAAEQLFRNPSMVFKSVSADARPPVLRSVLDAARSVTARVRTKLLRGLETGGDIDVLPTLRASDLTAREVVSTLAPDSLYHMGLSNEAVRGDVAGARAKVPAAPDLAIGDSKRLPASDTEFLNTPLSTSIGAEAGRTDAANLGKERSPASIAKALDWHGNLHQVGSSRGAEYHASDTPAMPFSRTWHELALKWALRHAVENGYDRVAWTTGETQNSRYDLSKRVSSDGLHWNTNRDGTVTLWGEDSSLSPFQHITKPNEIDKYVGEDIARGINADIERGVSQGQLTGDNLKIGGSGMTGFYDQMLPAAVNKLVKKWGGRVEEGRVNPFGYGTPRYRYRNETTGELSERPTENDVREPNPDYGTKAHVLAITPAMRAGISEGFPLYSIKDKADAAGNWWNDPTNVMERRSPEDIAALSPERQRIAAKIVLPRDIGEAKTFLNPFESAYQKGIRSLVSLEKLDKVTGAAAGPVEQRIGAVAELASGSAARADVFINGKGAFEYGAEDAPATVESMKKILAPLGPKRVNDVRDAAVALRVMDYESRGLKSGFDPADAAAVRAEFAQNAPEVLEAAEKINRLNDAALRYFRDAGGLSDGAYNAMEYMNHFYVPFKRVFEGADVDQGAWGKLKEKVGWVNTEPSPVGRTGGGEVAGASSGRPGAWKPIQRIKGGGRPILDPITASAEHITKLIRAGDLNRVKLMLADAMEADPDGLTGIIEKIPSTEHNARISTEAQNILTNATARGITMTPEQAMELSILSDKGLTMTDNSFRVFRDGKLMEYKVAPEIAETLSAMGPQGLKGLFNLLAIPSRMLRTGVTRNPAFGVFNMMRDTIDAGIQSKNGFIPVLDSLRGFREAVREGGHGDIRQEWLATGAGYSSVSAAGLHGAEAMAREAMPKTRFQSILTTVRHPLEALSDLGRPFEESTRLGEFMRAKAAGKSSMEAGLDSARVTTNFTVHGADPLVRQLAQITAFMNPAIQGLDTMGRRTVENPVAMMFKATMLLSAPSAAIWALNKDDERINELRKTKGGQLYWFVSPGRTTGKMDDKAKIYRIPKPFLWGQAFATGIETALDTWVEDDPRAAGEWAKGMVDVAGFNVLPTILNEPASQIFNKDMFFGTPLVQDKQLKLEPRYQAGPNTGEAARWIGDKLNWSPARIEHGARGVFGGLGQAAMKAADKIAPTDGTVRPTAQAADDPLFGRFVARWPTTGTSSISRFYDDSKKAETAAETLKHIGATRQDRVPGHIEAHQAEIEASEMFNDARKDMAEINQAIEAFRRSADLTPDEKREKLDELVLLRNQIAKSVNAMNPMNKPKPGDGWASIFGGQQK